MKINPLNTAVAYTVSDKTGDAATVDDGKQILAQNTSSSTGRYINIANNAGDTRIASFFLQPNTSVLVRKDSDQKIYASTGSDGTGDTSDVLFTITGFYD